MMWMMMRMNRAASPSDETRAGRAPRAIPGARPLSTLSVTDAAADPELARLRAELDGVHARQDAIAAQIRQLETEESPAPLPTRRGR